MDCPVNGCILKLNKFRNNLHCDIHHYPYSIDISIRGGEKCICCNYKAYVDRKDKVVFCFRCKIIFNKYSDYSVVIPKNNLFKPEYKIIVGYTKLNNYELPDFNIVELV